MEEICKKINGIIIDELKEYINKFTNVVKLDEDIISLINHIVDELENAYHNNLIDTDTYNRAINVKDTLISEIKNNKNKYLNMDMIKLLG